MALLIKTFKKQKMIRQFILLVLSFILISCQSKPQEVTGIWFHAGSLKTENDFYNPTNWETFKQNSEKTDAKFSEEYVVMKLTLNENHTFSEQYFKTKPKEQIDTTFSGNWKLANDTLILTTDLKPENESIERYFLIQSNDSAKLQLKIIREILREKEKSTVNFDFQTKQKKFDNLINTVGLDHNEFYAKSDEYFEDFWEFINFGKYQILSKRTNSDDQINHYNQDIKDLIYGNYWESVPYYDPISEYSKGRLVFNKNDQLKLIYQDLSSQSGWCGTLSNADYSTTWNWDKSANTITIHHKKEGIPPEIRRMFRSENPKNEKYKILAKNKFVMIWEKL